MKIVILGGYGVFGARLARLWLARLLLRDGHSVWIAGRSFQKAERFAARLGGQPIQLDLMSGLQPILQVNPHTVCERSRCTAQSVRWSRLAEKIREIVVVDILLALITSVDSLVSHLRYRARESRSSVRRFVTCAGNY